MTRPTYRLTAALTLISFMLLGCAGYGPNDRMIGSTRDEVIKILGKPSGERIAFDTQILMYERGPYGKHTYFVYIDQNGQMAGWSQVLNEKNFDLIKPGMTKEEVISILGESKVKEGIAFGRGYVWSWRYVNFHCSWFRVEFTPENTVRYAMYQKPPECRVRR